MQKHLSSDIEIKTFSNRYLKMGTINLKNEANLEVQDRTKNEKMSFGSFTSLEGSYQCPPPPPGIQSPRKLYLNILSFK